MITECKMYHVSFLLLTWVLCVSNSNMSVMEGCGLMVGWGVRSGLGGQGWDHWRGEVRLDHCNKERQNKITEPQCKGGESHN